MEMVRRMMSNRMKPARARNNFQSVMAYEWQDRRMEGDARGIEHDSVVESVRLTILCFVGLWKM